MSLLLLLTANKPFLNCFGPNSSSYSSSRVVVVGDCVGIDGVGSGDVGVSGEDDGGGNGAGNIFFFMRLRRAVGRLAFSSSSAY